MNGEHKMATIAEQSFRQITSKMSELHDIELEVTQVSHTNLLKLNTSGRIGTVIHFEGNNYIQNT